MTNASEVDPFESKLVAIPQLDIGALTQLEKDVGLGDGGSWWLDPNHTPVELDDRGDYDESRMLDVEAQVHTWLRHSFDKNPQFRDHSYHLFNRLNELARLQGLAEQAQLRQSTDVDDIGRDTQLYHSTLSLHSNAIPNLGASYDLTTPTFGLHHFDVHRSLEGSLVPQRQQHAQMDHNYGPPDPRNGSFSGITNTGMGNLSLSSSQLNNSWTHGSPSQAALSGMGPGAKPSGMPQLHKNSKRPSNHPNYNLGKRPSYPGIDRLPNPNMTSSPDRSHDRRKTLLSRTYSKEQLDVLRGNENPSGQRKHSAHGSMLSNFLPHADTNSADNVAKSLDTTSGVNPLSQSLSDADMLTLMKLNASHSSMQASHLLEIARAQESHLRKHSGSRGRLHGSSGSLTDSLQDMRSSADHPFGSVSSRNPSNESIARNQGNSDLSKSYDGVMVFRDAARRQPVEREIVIREKNRTENADGEEDEDNRRTLIMSDNGKLVDLGSESRNDMPAKPLQHLPDGPSGDHEFSEPPTPIVNDPSKLGRMHTVVNTEPPPVNVFFPQSSTNVDQNVPAGASDRKNPVTRLDSFELLEARMSSDPISPSALKSTVPKTPAHSTTVPVSSTPGTTTETACPVQIGSPVSTTLTAPRAFSRSTSPGSNDTSIQSYARPPLSPRVSSTSNEPSGKPVTGIHSRLPVQSKIPAPSASSIPVNTKMGFRSFTPSQGVPSMGQRSRPSSAQSSSISRLKAREPMSQIQPIADPKSRIPMHPTPAGPKADVGHQSRSVSSQLRVTHSDTSPVRSTRMNNKRLGQRPTIPSARRM